MKIHQIRHNRNRKYKILEIIFEESIKEQQITLIIRKKKFKLWI